MSALAILTEYPLIAAAIGAVFIVLGRRARRWGAVGVGLAWVLYAAYETGMQQRWLCTGECNIRVDLVLIYPVLLVASAIAGFSAARAKHPR